MALPVRFSEALLQDRLGSCHVCVAAAGRLDLLAVVDDVQRLCNEFPIPLEILSEISEIETFASGSGIREIARLRRIYGRGRWRKRKGIARIRLPDGSVHIAELHWYEAAGIGRKEPKIKHLL
jgi:hypothetical protein